MSTTKYFLDTEFIEDGKTIDLISLGIVCEDGRELYLQNSECEFQKASDWVWRNVFPHLEHFDMRGKRRCSGTRHHTKCSTKQDAPCPWGSRREIREMVLDFCSLDKHGKPEFWGYFSDYDWVVFCQLFGTMVELPKGFPMYCRDIKQWVDDCGDIRIPKPEPVTHHAMHDARWIKEAYSFLMNRQVTS